MDKISNKIGLVLLFFVSFVFFLYLSFPYGVLKEAISSQVQMSTGVVLRIEELGPAFPFGFSARNLEISSNGGTKVNFKEVSVRFSPLQLFLLRLGINVEIEASNKGYLDSDIGFGILKLVSGAPLVPSHLKVSAKAFPLDSLVSYGLRQAVSGSSASAIAGPLLEALAFRGKLEGTAAVSIDAKAMAQSTGDIKLAINDAALILSDPSIGLPDQIFKTAQIRATMEGGVFKIDPATRFASDELEFGADGKINVKNSFNASDLDLKLIVRLSGGLGEKFGWVMDGLSGGASKGGNLNLQVRGTVGAPVATGL